MSRLYLSILFVISSMFASGQANISKYLDFAQEQFDKGDYYYALQYYEKAMEIDSNTIDILWRVAETHRAYKDYRKAEYYYAKVYSQEEAKIYPASLLNLGLMQKQNGKYEAALSTFKKAKKKYYKDKKGYLYQKAKRELESTVWAKSNQSDSAKVIVEQLPTTINTQNAEFGHGLIGDKFIFSSLRADSINQSEEVYSTEYKTRLYSSTTVDSTFEESALLKDLFMQEFHNGNGAFSLDSSRFYFSVCGDQGYNYRCKIYVAQYSNGRWFHIDSLGPIINEPGSNTTMPCIADLDGQEVLIFASDREESEGGLDLFMSKVRNGNQYSKVRAIKKLNSLDNEITPWWNPAESRLYFSSSWHDGFGGYDIFYSAFKAGFEAPVNVGQPYNSPANDLYYFMDADTAYISTNRLGVYYSKNPTCCSDIFAIHPPKIVIPPTKEETLADLNKRLPVTLYFHNDIPNPRSRDTTTSVNYIDSYNDYTAMLPTYKDEYSKGLKGEKSDEAKEDIESFFIEYVDQGVADLELFRDLLLIELEKGAKINITVKGFASPLAKTDYNVNLTKRRIASLVNYMREWNNGTFIPYLDGTASNGGQVVFSQVPFGEYTANQLTSDNPNDVQNSVYSRAAAIERKIEIQSVSYLENEEEFALETKNPVHDFGAVTNDQVLEKTFVITNQSNKEVTLNDLRIPCDCVEASIEKLVLGPGESTELIMKLDSNKIQGFFVHSVYLSIQGSEQELRVYTSGQKAE